MDEQIRQIVEPSIKEQVFPGAVVGYLQDGRRQVAPFGHLTYDPHAPKVTADTVYDVASITKSIPLNLIILSLIEKGTLSAEDPVVTFIPELQQVDRDKILIKHLMTYTVAFHLPKRMSEYAPEGADAIFRAIFTSPLRTPPGKEYVYSNAPAILLGMVAERVLKKPLDEIAQELFFEPLGMHHTTFHPDQLTGALVAPTEITDRGEIQGAVHDETAWALHKAGHMCGNAGVFTIADDLLNVAEMLLAGGTYKGKQYFKPATIALMHTNQAASTGESTGFGWELGQKRFMGSKASAACFGKIGFTGTIILIDPVKQASLVLLSNRTYPHRGPDSNGINSVRSRLADTVFG